MKWFNFTHQKRITMFPGLGLAFIIGTMVWPFIHGVAIGAVPQLINFQGILRDGSGNPVANGTYSVIFTIYDASIGGTAFWAETTSVTTASGLFNKRLGLANPIPDSATGLSKWLGIAVSPDPEMTPRTHLASVPHAYKISTVEGASGGIITGDVYLQGTGPDDVLALTSTADPNVAIELRSGTAGGDPYIDFANDAASDFDARIQLQGNNGLQIVVPSLLSVTGKVSIGPGHTNTGINAFVAGENNKARGHYSVVSGGGGPLAADSNSASGYASTVGGGETNAATNINSTVGGGSGNTASGFSATVSGGAGNIASELYATVSGGLFNLASGVFSSIPGGYDNKATGRYSLAAGRRALAVTLGTFVWADSSADADFASTASNQFLIRAAGGVGIGTNSPGEQLDISNPNSSGNSIVRTNRASTAVAGGLILATAGVNKWSFRHPPTGTDNFVVFNHSLGSSTMAFDLTNNNVGIGTTAPAALLHVNGTAGNNTGVWSNLSDKRLKKDIEPIRNALATVEQLQPVSFRWKDETKDAQFGRVRGLIAQDVEKVIPEWIKTDPDGYKRIEPIGVDALLIEAIKEQQKQIEELKKEIMKLKNQPSQAQFEN